MLAFIDTEVNVKTKRIQDIGCVKEQGEQFHGNSISELVKFLKRVDILVGHNIVNHDIVYLRKTEASRHISPSMCIDTLFLSTLLFPEKPYHALVKDDKLESDSINNPLIDAQRAQKLFYDEIVAFEKLDDNMKEIFYTLLKDIDGFSAFFRHVRFQRKVRNIEELIGSHFDGLLCSNVDLASLVRNHPRELAFALSLVRTNDVTSLLPPWVLKNYAHVEFVISKLRNTPCIQGCKYCETNLDPKIGLKKYFDYDSFRDFEGVPLQERAVRAALRNESLIAVFPTGGGKSLAFQLPALMSRENNRGLTVVISPLQSLMKDQVDNLEAKGITYSETINGLLDPIQRSKAIERVSSGDVSILYIAPESLRSKTIEKLILGRQVVRFVIDEAHCFSSWGHDFRVDYLYIGDFIKNIQTKKNLPGPIPVSCFTATAKQQVIRDIHDYFQSKLGINMSVFEASSQRKNLKFKVYEVNNKDSKYNLLRNLIDQENAPTIVYASRRRTVEELGDRLVKDGYSAVFFHGGMEVEEKIAQQNLFMIGKAQIMVATSAFGMGVDKADVGCVIHYEISDSLENYVQESGRAGRDEKINANCYILYHDDDLNKHFEMLNRSKVNLKEIQQIWKAIKEITKFRDTVSQSALEIARAAGWDDTVQDLQTRVTTAISVLEESGYLKRSHNSPRLFANSIMAKSVSDAHQKIDSSGLFLDTDKVYAKRIISKLISSKSKSWDDVEMAESRVDYISDDLGIPKADVIRILNQLREIHLLTDDQDLSAFIKPGAKTVSITKMHSAFISLLRNIVSNFSQVPDVFHYKIMNGNAIDEQLTSSVKEIRKVINFLEMSKWIELERVNADSLIIKLTSSKEEIATQIDKLVRVSEVILDYLLQKSNNASLEKANLAIQFSIMELKNHYENQKSLLDASCTTKDIENGLFFLQKTGSIQIEGGFMVTYSPMQIERVVKDGHKSYTKSDYQRLEDYYIGKMQQIHIVGEYARKMIEDYAKALQFVDDYFQFEYPDFLNKYFVGRRKKDIQINMTPKRFQQLFGSLSEDQLKIILDKEHKRISVAAGPGSGKTKLLVHKLASIVYTEDIRQEQLLMLTFSRAAVSEFKHRLIALLGSAAPYIEITTFHSFCFDILGRVGALEKSDEIVKQAAEMIRNGEADPIRITKMVLVIDEAQDMSKDEFDLVSELINYNDNLRVIAVGDDDQNIFEFRGSSSEFFKHLSDIDGAFYELPVNYRSKKNIVDFANVFVKKIHNRLKTIPIRSNTNENGLIKVIKYDTSNLVIPVAQDVISRKLTGTTCIIAKTNEQAIQITGLLNKHQIPAKLIQANDDFRLIDLLEIRFLVEQVRLSPTPIIGNEFLIDCIRQFHEKYANSTNCDLCMQIMETFISTAKINPTITDFEEFLNDSALSEFVPKADVLVSTIHKAKGKEFDNVFILYENEYAINDVKARELYVALTRAKNFLSIHTNSSYFDHLHIDNLEYRHDSNSYIKPERLVFQLNHRSVNLGYFAFVAANVRKLLPGSTLEVDEFPVLKYQGRKVLKVSTKYEEEYVERKANHYELISAVVKHIVYWFDKTTQIENLIVLPELTYDLVEIEIDDSNQVDLPNISESLKQDEEQS